MANGGISIKVEGLSDLGKTMLELKDNVAKRIIRKAVKAGAEVVVKAAKSNSLKTKDSGDMYDAIGSRRDVRSSRPGLEFRATGIFKVKGGTYANTKANVRAGRKGGSFLVDPPTFYWKFIEFGAPSRNFPAQPFLVPAFDATKGEQINEVKRVLHEEIIRAQRFAARKAGR